MKIRLYKNYYKATRLNSRTDIVYSYYSDFNSAGHDVIMINIPERLKPENYGGNMVSIKTADYTYDICEYLTAYGERGVEVEVLK